MIIRAGQRRKDIRTRLLPRWLVAYGFDIVPVAVIVVASLLLLLPPPVVVRRRPPPVLLVAALSFATPVGRGSSTSLTQTSARGVLLHSPPRVFPSRSAGATLSSRSSPLLISHRSANDGEESTTEASVSSSSSSSFNIYFDSTNHLHRDLRYHPEQPERIFACVRAISSAFFDHDDEDKENDHDGATSGGLIRLVDIAVDLNSEEKQSASPSISGRSANRTRTIVHEPVSIEELVRARSMLVLAHSEELVSCLEMACQNARQRRIDDGKSDPCGHMGYLGGDLDCYVTTESFPVCQRAAAAWIRAADVARAQSTADRVGVAMALTRPPGHHATRTLQNGFCLYNFAAATALSALASSLTKTGQAAPIPTTVSVLDFDVHYGQGTADILASNPRARYVSVHQTPAFPYEGEKLQLSGVNQNVYTIPIPPSTSWDCGYSDAFDKALGFCMEAGVWEPDLVVVSAGFDALDSDPLASVSLQASDFGRMADRLHEHLVRESLSPLCRKKRRPAIVLGLEGGYQIDETSGGGNLPVAVVAMIQALLEARRRGNCPTQPTSLKSFTGLYN